MEKSDHNSLTHFLCEEDKSCLNQRFLQNPGSDFDSVSLFDDEYIQNLIQRESIFQSDGNGVSMESEKSLFQRARLDAITWILKTKDFFGFHIRTAYLSIIYFDRFFSRRPIDVRKFWAIRLLSIACLSLAAKMEEFQAPALCEYHDDKYNFEAKAIQRMELLVLTTLEWRLSSITPFAYLHYFSAKLCGEFRQNQVLNIAVNLILAVIKETNVGEYRPSIIAAAAVLASYDYALTQKNVENEMNAIPSLGSFQKEEMFSCYNLLRKTRFVKYNTPISVISRNSLSTQSGADNALGNSSTTSTAGTRRRLEFSDGETSSPPQKISRPRLA